MFLKYVMIDGQDYRGNVKLVVRNAQGEDVAYTSRETKDDDMIDLVDAEIDLVQQKAGEDWSDHRTFLKTNIDRLASHVRVSHLEVGDSIDIEYFQVEDALLRWQDNGSPTDDVPDEIQAWVDVTGETLQWAVDDIEYQIGRLRDMIRQIRRRRLEAKAAIDAAPSDQIVATYNDHFAIIDALHSSNQTT